MVHLKPFADDQGDVIYKRVGDINPRIWRDELAPRFRQLGIAMTIGNTDAEPTSESASALVWFGYLYSFRRIAVLVVVCSLPMGL